MVALRHLHHFLLRSGDYDLSVGDGGDGDGDGDGGDSSGGDVSTCSEIDKLLVERKCRGASEVEAGGGERGRNGGEDCGEDKGKEVEAREGGEEVSGSEARNVTSLLLEVLDADWGKSKSEVTGGDRDGDGGEGYSGGGGGGGGGGGTGEGEGVGEPPGGDADGTEASLITEMRVLLPLGAS